MSTYTTNKRPLKGNSVVAFPNNFTVIDIETTGLCPATDRIIEVSAIKVKDGSPVKTFSSLLNPERRIGTFVTNLTGITNEMLANAPNTETVLTQFSDFIGEDILVGHNVNFDINFLYDWLLEIKPLRNDFIDTMRIAKKKLPMLHHHRLCDIAEYFGISQENAHRALVDCETTLACFNSMCCMSEGLTAEKTQLGFSKAQGSTQSHKRFMSKEELHKALNTLVGILSGIAADGFVVPAESDEVQNWYALHRELINIQPFEQILPVLDKALLDGCIDKEEVQDILWLCQSVLKENQDQLYFDYVSSQIQQLEGMLHGLISDAILSDVELESLSGWMSDNEFLCGTYPFDELYSLLLAAKEDGTISEDERNMLKAFFTNFVDTRSSYHIHEREAKELRDKYAIQGICATHPNITFEGKTFCFTGTSQRATRNEIASIIEGKGAHFINGVSRKINYLIVGGDGNPCWAFSCYGRKVEQAMQLRKEGHKIIIVHENDFWDEI